MTTKTKGCNRCGGWVAEPKTIPIGKDGDTLDIYLCRQCLLIAQRENDAALDRRTGKDVQ